MISHISSISSKELNEQLFSVYKNLSDEVSLLIRQAPENIVESVHLIRKRLKFLRAFVKLTQLCSDGDQYKQINIVFRNCGRLISDCRDAHVRTLLLDEFKMAKAKRPYARVIDELIEVNNGQTGEIENELLSGTSVFDDLQSDLTKETVLNYFHSLDPDVETLLRGYALCYKKSYNAFHSELTNHESNLLHEWRKRTKDLQYQQEVLAESIPDDLPPSLEEVSELCEQLGRINDLYMLSEWIRVGEVEEHSTLFLDEIEIELESIQNETDECGQKLYRLAPEEYSDELQKVVHA